ncbi:Crp/Fnr family transcriptional regulator [Rhizobium sp. JAB6]|uniref:Crp/Fnr family transcriptional regulator n=1 Tax=Rhizobium sp. JAB6 TaxID=2127050 RepID=UPI001FDFFD26|nr:Crp/Fnr family transcriptional regulator [Rhizobium sp. JAB6]
MKAALRFETFVVARRSVPEAEIEMDTTIDILTRNLLLSRMDTISRSMIVSALEPVELPVKYMLSSFERKTEFCYFLSSGIASVVARSPRNKTSEVGIIGREGMVPASLILHSGPAAFDIFMQVSGHGQRIRVELLEEVLRTTPTLRELIGKYVQTFLIQSAYTSLANANHSAQERLARWILMCHDRVDGDCIPLTHEFLATMLAVRRPTVTDAFHALEGRRLIRSERGLITVRDRAGLEAFARDCYGRAENEYRNLIGEFR